MLNILFASSEVQPLMKTGGLADVSGALPIALKKMRHQVRVVMPAYGDTLKHFKKSAPIATLHLPGIPGQVEILKKKLPDSSVDVYFIHYEPAFARTGNPYSDTDGNPWQDNAERFALFCRSVCEIATNRAGLDWQPDLVHCNDWQTGLVPALLSLEQSRPATIFTIHNLAYQGLFPHSTFTSLGLADSLWSSTGLEFYDQLSFIKGGIVFADRINTVSTRYAKEIQTSEFGNGLEGLLLYRSNRLSGIINGIDDTIWNPAQDPALQCQYDKDNFALKISNKRFLQTQFNFAQDNSQLLLGFIGRLVEQKGIDLIIAAIADIMALPVQLLVLGSGNKAFERQLQLLTDKYPGKLHCSIGYNEVLSHQIEAGCDVFLMPSRFEPCGLNQLYSLRYGTIPIVTNVGGLADTVIALNDKQSNLELATGFMMRDITAKNLYEQIVNALHLYQTPDKWQRLALNGMQRDWSWQRSAQQYVALYKLAIQDNYYRKNSG